MSQTEAALMVFRCYFHKSFTQNYINSRIESFNRPPFKNCLSFYFNMLSDYFIPNCCIHKNIDLFLDYLRTLGIAETSVNNNNNFRWSLSCASCHASHWIPGVWDQLGHSCKVLRATSMIVFTLACLSWSFLNSWGILA